MQADYEFASQDGGKTYTRKLFGIEQLVAVMSYVKSLFKSGLTCY